MNQQFLNRQYLPRNINSNLQQFSLPLHQLPSYSPLLYGGNQQQPSPQIQQISHQPQLNQQQQSSLSPGPNQKYFLQNVPLVKSLPQNFAANLHQTQQQPATNNLNNYSTNSQASNTSSAHFISGNRDSQNQQQNYQQQNLQQLNSNYYSSGQLFYTPNNNQPSSASKTSEKFYDAGQSNKNNEKIRPPSQGSNNNEHVNTQSSTQTNSVNQSQLKQQQQVISHIQKTPEKTQLKIKNLYHLSPQSVYLSEKKPEVQKCITLPSEIQVNHEYQNKSNIKTAAQLIQKYATDSAEQKLKTQYYDVSKIKQFKNQSSVPQQQQNGQQNQSLSQTPQQKVVITQIQNNSQLNDSKENGQLLEEGQFKQQNKIIKQDEIKEKVQPNTRNLMQFLSNQSPNLATVPLELIYDGNAIIENNSQSQFKSNNLLSFQTNTNPEVYDNYQHSLSQFNQSRPHILSIKEEEPKELQQLLKDEIKKLKQENVSLKKQLVDQQQEYKYLLRNHQDLEKKYINLQNQITLPSSSCNSSLIILQEDKNQQILYDIANNCSSLSKIQSKSNSHHNFPYSNNYNSNNINTQSFKKDNQPNNIEEQFYLASSQNKQQNTQFNSPPQNANINNSNTIDNMSQLYNSITVESQFFHNQYPNLEIIPSQPSIDEDYNYKKNNNSKIDQLLQKGSYNPSLVQSKNFELKFASDQKQQKFQQKIPEQFTLSSDQPKQQNFMHSYEQSQQPLISNRSNYAPNSNSITEFQNKLSREAVIDAINRADEVLRKSHYTPSVYPNQSEFQQKRNATQYIPK